MWKNSFDTLNESIKKGAGINPAKVGYNSPDFDLFTSLQSDAARFSAFKNHQEQKALYQLMLDEEGKIRTFSQFKKLALPVTGQYNQNWLASEYHAALANAQAAKKWAGFEKNTDLYPNLEYRTAGDADVRPSHQALNGLILPVNDPQWKTIYPPNGWGCRCYVTQTDKIINRPVGWENIEPDKGFDFNPGIEKKLFSDTAGYYQAEGKKEIAKAGETLLIKESRKSGFDQVGKVFNAKGLGKVKVTKNGMKEAINQPHDNYYKKNMALLNLKSLLKDQNWKPMPEMKGDLSVKQYHYAQIALSGEKSYIIVKELHSGDFEFYTITDKIKKAGN